MVAVAVTYYTYQALGEGVWAAMTAAAAAIRAGQATGNVPEAQRRHRLEERGGRRHQRRGHAGVKQRRGGVPPPTTASAMARAAIANVLLTQGAAVALGASLQDHFDWRGVVASAVGEGLDAMGPSRRQRAQGQPVQASARTAGLATPRPGWAGGDLQTGATVFGQALGTSVGGFGDQYQRH